MSTDTMNAKVQELRELRRMQDELAAEIEAIQDELKGHMDAHGMDALSISKRLGHSKVSTTTDIYAHVIAAADQQNADILADIFLRKI